MIMDNRFIAPPYILFCTLQSYFLHCAEAAVNILSVTVLPVSANFDIIGFPGFIQSRYAIALLCRILIGIFELGISGNIDLISFCIRSLCQL